MPSFTLHPRLEAGSFEIGTTAGCLVLLKDNASFPWFLIVPEVPEAVQDLHQLNATEYRAVMELVRRVSVFIAGYFRPDKLNVACIGNQVRQLHIHIVARSEGDAAWPGTVWASAEKTPWEPDRIAEIRQSAREALMLE